MKIVAITSCHEGIAFTYMSAFKLASSAKNCGHSISIEKQGQCGIEDYLTPDVIKDADYVILAVENEIEEPERFIGKKVMKCSVKTPIQLGDKIFDFLPTDAIIYS